MIKQIIGDGFFGIKLTPILTGKEQEFKIAKKDKAISQVIFNTATSTMRVVNKSGKKYMEHLKLDGSIELLPFNGKFLGDLNFINFGWQYPDRIEYIIVDPYTGETKQQVKAN